MKKVVSLLTAVSIAALSTASYAAHIGGYAGLGLGASSLNTEKKYLQEDAPGTSQSYKIGGLGGRLFAGYNFNQYVGIEAGLAQYAPSTYKWENGASNQSLKQNQTTFDVVGKAYLPIQDSGFNLYALGGLAYVNSKVEFNNKIVILGEEKTSVTSNKIRPIYGIGASYDFPETNVTAGVEYTRISGQDKLDIQKIGALQPNQSTDKSGFKSIADSSMLTFNIAYNFS